jgi:threonine synthase
LSEVALFRAAFAHLPQHQRTIARRLPARGVAAGQAPDRGLYFPKHFRSSRRTKSPRSPNCRITKSPFACCRNTPTASFRSDVLAAMCRDAYNFPDPAGKNYDRVFLMRLDQGPTASFKDFAAQMMARMFGRFLREDGRQVTILTATSGDTGAAVAHAFHKSPASASSCCFPLPKSA